MARARKALDWSQDRLAEEMGIKQPSLSAIERGETTELKFETVMRLVVATGRELSYFIGSGSGRAIHVISEPSPIGTASFLIPVYAAEAAQGAGRAAPEADTMIGAMQVTRPWAERHLRGVSGYGNLRVITAIGDSNSPTINDGDPVIVDMGATQLKTDTFFVFGREDEILIKRVHRMLSGEIIIRGDNPASMPERLNLKTPPRVVGRIVYVWNGKRV